MAREPYADPVFEALGISQARNQRGAPAPTSLAGLGVAPPAPWPRAPRAPWAWPGLGVPPNLPGERPWPAAWPESQGPYDADFRDSPSEASSPEASRKVRVELNLAERTSPPEFAQNASQMFFTPTKSRTSFRADAPVFVPRDQDAGFETPAKVEATSSDFLEVRSRMLRIRQLLEDDSEGAEGSSRGDTSPLQLKTARRSQVPPENLHGAGRRQELQDPGSFSAFSALDALDTFPHQEPRYVEPYHPGLQPKALLHAAQAVAGKVAGPQPLGRVL